MTKILIPLGGYAVESPLDRNRPVKSWGFEEWIVNNELYCGKKLYFLLLGGATSMHFHANKHETMYVESGSFEITLIDVENGSERTLILEETQSLVIPPLTPHRIRAIRLSRDNAVLIEFSTHHEDNDSYRVAK